jgi:ergothioneine biosynthesis protein EgtB
LQKVLASDTLYNTKISQKIMNSTLLLKCWKDTRDYSLSIAALLTAEDAAAQSMPDASPTKWHLAHTTWFFETFILEKFEPDFQPFNSSFRILFNSYYNGISEQFPRPQRGLLTRPGLNEVLQYRQAVDKKIEHVIHHFCSPQLDQLIELGIQHEQQHQELMLSDIKHLLSCNPLSPALLNKDGTVISDSVCADQQTMDWHFFESHLHEIGYQGEGFCFDNEKPRHRQFVEEFQLASQLVNNREYLAFIEAGSYQNPALWLADGWNWVRVHQIQHPLYWRRNQTWQEFTLHGLVELDPLQPVCHLSYFEAAAYAAWVGARLPTEAEWEVATLKNNQLHLLFDCCWQWTSSSYSAYPGYTPAPGAIGEYNGKFMANQYVLRGSSLFTPKNHSRVTYRNFFPATARWQRTGIRLARD